MSTLQRLTFEISRAAEYFTADELEKQTGQPAEMFAAVALKELVDNALDAAETKEVAPSVDITVEVRAPLLWLTVTDNGGGLTADTIGRILNFTTRTSDKTAYRAPTRGAQGNALKTVIGIPFALQCRNPVSIESQGVRHTIHSQLDLAGDPKIVREMEPSERDLGTTIRVCLPASGQKFYPERWAKSFSLFNPHATVRMRLLGDTAYLGKGGHPDGEEDENSYHSTVTFPETWHKFLPTDPTSPWWYNAVDLARLIGLHNAAAENGEKALTLREFVRHFRGLSGTAKAKAVCAMVPQQRLADFEQDPGAIGRLLAAMQSQAPQPAASVLGRVGEAHFRARFNQWYRVERYWYKKAEGELAGIPFLFEIAVAETDRSGGLFTGVNFSPTFDDPFAETELGVEGKIDVHGIRSFLSQAHVLPAWDFGENVSAAVAVHLICPALHFLDRGKSRLKIPPRMASVIADATWKACRELYQEGERREKDAAKQNRQIHAAARQRQTPAPRRISLVEAVFEVLAEAMQSASGDGKYPVSARTLYYQVRPLLQKLVDKELEYRYFSQELLTRYSAEVGRLPGLYYDPKGILYEPHTGRTVPIGTREVDAYDFPAWRYNKILYIEKKGLWPQIQQAALGERYDMAVIAAEGYATTAARAIFARADQDQQYRLFVLHDADPYGYNIARTLQEETQRLPGYQVEVTDLGLRYEEALELGLEAELFTRRNDLPKELTLTPGEERAFRGRKTAAKQWECRRVELNAFTAPALLAYIERKLIEAGADNKVIPPDRVLENRGRALYEETIREQVVSLVWDMVSRRLNLADILSKAESVGMAAVRAAGDQIDFERARQWIEAAFAKNKASTWDKELDERVVALTGLPSGVAERVKQYLRDRLKS